jgi:hypothetical protein
MFRVFFTPISGLLKRLKDLLKFGLAALFSHRYLAMQGPQNAQSGEPYTFKILKLRMKILTFITHQRMIRRLK